MPSGMLTTTFQIANLPGDGIGVDVMAEALRVLRAVEGGMGSLKTGQMSRAVLTGPEK